MAFFVVGCYMAVKSEHELESNENDASHPEQQSYSRTPAHRRSNSAKTTAAPAENIARIAMRELSIYQVVAAFSTARRHISGMSAMEDEDDDRVQWGEGRRKEFQGRKSQSRLKGRLYMKSLKRLSTSRKSVSASKKPAAPTTMATEEGTTPMKNADVI